MAWMGVNCDTTAGSDVWIHLMIPISLLVFSVSLRFTQVVITDWSGFFFSFAKLAVSRCGGTGAGGVGGFRRAAFAEVLGCLNLSLMLFP
jgi:hypothetical protein